VELWLKNLDRAPGKYVELVIGVVGDDGNGQREICAGVTDADADAAPCHVVDNECVSRFERTFE